MNLDLTSDLQNGKKKFILAPGKYFLTKTITVSGIDKVDIRGSTGNPVDVELIFTDGMDGIVVKNSDYFNLHYLTVTLNDTHQNAYQGIPLVMEQCNRFNVSGCVFNGTQRGFGFGVFLAGSGVWSDQDLHNINSDGYQDDPVNLDKRSITMQKMLQHYDSNSLMNSNTFKNNILNCKSKDDGLLFSLQYASDCSNNVVRGTKLSVIMCRNCNISNNLIVHSVTDGMYLSTPCNAMNVNNNKINSPQNNGIVIDEQIDCTSSQIQQDSDNFNIDVCFNTIITNTAGSVGICMKGCRNTTIRKNNLYVPGAIGILTRGRITGYDEAGNGIYGPSCSGNTILQNNINMYFNSVNTTNIYGLNSPSTLPSISLTEYSNNNKVSQNNIWCAFPGVKKIQFYECRDKKMLVNNVPISDPENKYPVNNHGNQILSNIVFVPKSSGITATQCYDTTSRTATQNKFSDNIVSGI